MASGLECRMLSDYMWHKFERACIYPIDEFSWRLGKEGKVQRSPE